MMARTTIDFGIDLGVGHACIAVIDGADAKVIPSLSGAGRTPCAVWIDKRGNLHVGLEAKQKALVDDPDNADLEFKLRMGSGAEGKKVFKRSGREMLPEELSAEVLKQLKMDVQTSMGELVRTAVITVPAAFELPSTDATQRAAKLAGFSRCPLLLEPVAASLAYGFQTKSDNVYWLVYDFGGGTFDAAVMRVHDGLIQVVNHYGDYFLGGKCINRDLVTKKLAPAAGSQFNLPDFRMGNPKWAGALGKMKWHAELAKIDVCRTKAPQEIWIEGLCQDANGRDVDFSYTLTPADVQEVSQPYIEQSLGLCRKTLKEKGLSGSSLERIIMVGGSTLSPWVRDAVQAELGSRLEFGIDPVTVVARGAAIFASIHKLQPNPDIQLPTGTWQVQIEHEPIGNVPDPDIGGRVIPTRNQSLKGYTVEFVDIKTRWRSGRITLGADGIFITQLFAEEARRCEYNIELYDPTGNRIKILPERITVTPDISRPQAPNSIGIARTNGEFAKFIGKGSTLPTRGMLHFHTPLGLRAGNAEDIIRILLFEGENSRASRNNSIGTVLIRGTDVRHDVAIGSPFEVTLIMDEYLKVTVKAYFQTIDEDFQAVFDLKMQHGSIGQMREEVAQQKLRLVTAREKADKGPVSKALEALARITREGLIEQIDSLIAIAEQCSDALPELDKKLRNLKTAIDQAEDALEWPLLLEKAENHRNLTAELVKDFGNVGEKNRFNMVKADLQRAIDSGEPDLLRQCTDACEELWAVIDDRQPEIPARGTKS
jgi:molecular chaperone DnaK